MALVAPEIAVSPFRHWKFGAGWPVTATVKVASAPAATVRLAGWVVMAGASVWTVRVTTSEVTVPRLLVTVTR